MIRELEFDIAGVLRIYMGSNGDDTKALYNRLETLGPVGAIATNLIRATKNSERAKGYRRGSSTGAAYQTKSWAMSNLCELLGKHGEQLGVRWGWGEDAKQSYHRHVLYVDIPTGQVSFHTDVRGPGPDYPGAWDGKPGQGPDRICRWAARLLKRDESEAAA